MRTCFCIDLRSFYASVECVERCLDPDTTDLVVADPSRTEKTICLAVSPSLKAKGVKNRCRLFQIPSNLKYIIAPPRMQKYIDYSTAIYGIYLEFFSCEDIHVYSIDEVFIDVTDYLKMYGITERALAQRILDRIHNALGLGATCGIGTNLYLAKVALDILAKHQSDRIAYLDEEGFKSTLWDHRPLTDFWRIGNGCAARLEKRGILTMRDIACADEDLLYKIFGIDAELIIDHAYGREPTTIKDIKNYKSKSNCLSSGQVLSRDYYFDEALVIVKEMTDVLCLELASKKLEASSLTLNIGYSNALDMPHAHGSTCFKLPTNSDIITIPAIEALYKRIVTPRSPIRRINITANNVVPASDSRQILLFEDIKETDRSLRLQDTIINIKHKFGKNSILKGMNFLEGATTRERNMQIGGHKSG